MKVGLEEILDGEQQDLGDDMQALLEQELEEKKQRLLKHLHKLYGK